MKLGIKVEGAEEIKKRLEKYAETYPEALAAALYQEGFDIWHDAVPRTPVEFGVLRSSAYVAPPTHEGKDVVVEVGYGTDYAIPQHERTELHHPRGGQAKFLESTVNEHMAGYLERVGERTEKNAAAGVGVTPLPAPTEPEE